MPLDLSPLATPIIRNKIEEPSVVETTHQDSPLPHPESTTNDEKVRIPFSFWNSLSESSDDLWVSCTR